MKLYLTRKQGQKHTIIKSLVLFCVVLNQGMAWAIMTSSEMTKIPVEVAQSGSPCHTTEVPELESNCQDVTTACFQCLPLVLSPFHFGLALHLIQPDIYFRIDAVQRTYQPSIPPPKS